MYMQTSYPVMPVLETDFNAIGVYCGCPDQRCGHVSCDVEDWLLRAGQEVVVTDGDGNHVNGKVEGMELLTSRWYATVRLDLATWRDGPDLP